MLKKTFKYILRFFLAFVAYMVLYFVVGFILTIIPSNNNFTPAKDGIDLYIISNGVHTDICFSKKDANFNWDTHLNFGSFQTPEPDLQYLSFGWGDKGFYFDTPTWAELTAKTALSAAFIPTPTAMHVSVLKDTPQVGEMIRTVKVSKNQLLAMESYILDHIQTKNEKALLIDCCRYDGYDDNFYEANGHYHMWRTCNTWANQVLKKGGIKTATWAPFDKCILHHFPLENKIAN